VIGTFCQRPVSCSVLYRGNSLQQKHSASRKGEIGPGKIDQIGLDPAADRLDLQLRQVRVFQDATSRSIRVPFLRMGFKRGQPVE